MSEDKMKTAAECKDQEKATDEDVQAFISHKLQQSRSGKCLLACIYEKSGAVSVFINIIRFVSLNFWCWKI